MVIKLMISGVVNSAAERKSPSFSRSSSSTTMMILPFFRSSIASGIVFNRMSDIFTFRFLQRYLELGRTAIFIWASFSALHSRFFVTLRSTKRAPFSSGRGKLYLQNIVWIKKFAHTYINIYL